MYTIIVHLNFVIKTYIFMHINGGKTKLFSVEILGVQFAVTSL